MFLIIGLSAVVLAGFAEAYSQFGNWRRQSLVVKEQSNCPPRGSGEDKGHQSLCLSKNVLSNWSPAR
jgi:hypothetical protein